ncbi:MAG TPA: hypothetical protein VJ951_11640 [Bacteroidales bacterium]|nr:hypothetical protein [Bacteroidales bacterium]
MSKYSSYQDIVRRKKEVHLQRKFLWDEISELHKSNSKNQSSFWVRQLLSVDPSVVLQTWKVAVKVGQFFKSKSKNED